MLIKVYGCKPYGSCILRFVVIRTFKMSFKVAWHMVWGCSVVVWCGIMWFGVVQMTRKNGAKRPVPETSD